MGLLRKLARAVVPAPATVQQKQQIENKQSSVVYTPDVKHEEEIVDIDSLYTPDEDLFGGDTAQDIEVPTSVVQPIRLSRLGEDIQNALEKYGIVKKYNIDAMVFLEDLCRTTEFNLFYFKYDSSIVSPADFMREIEKDKSSVSLNLNAVIICDGLQLKFISDGVGCVVVAGGL